MRPPRNLKEMPALADQEKILIVLKKYKELEEIPSKTSEQWYAFSILGGYLGAFATYSQEELFKEHFEFRENMVLKYSKTGEPVLNSLEDTVRIEHTLIVKDEANRYQLRPISFIDNHDNFVWMVDYYEAMIDDNPQLLEE